MRPTPLSRVWSGRKTIAEDLAGEDLGDVLDHATGDRADWTAQRKTPVLSSSYSMAGSTECRSHCLRCS
jgi:hypothetical protein